MPKSFRFCSNCGSALPAQSEPVEKPTTPLDESSLLAGLEDELPEFEADVPSFDDVFDARGTTSVAQQSAVTPAVQVSGRVLPEWLFLDESEVDPAPASGGEQPNE